MKPQKLQAQAGNSLRGRGRINNFILALFKGDFIVRYNLKKPNGQTLLEYLVLIGIVTTVVVVLTPYMKRSIQSIVKVTADQLGTQTNSDQGVTGSYLVDALSQQSMTTSKKRNEFAATKEYIDDDVTTGSSQSLTNIGFSPRSR